MYCECDNKQFALDDKQLKLNENSFSLMEYINKILELNIIKDVEHMFHETYQQKEETIKNIYAKSNNMYHDLWTARDQFCQQAWNFSFKHNFNTIFNQYPYITNCIKHEEYEYKTPALCTGQNQEMCQIINEIDLIKQNIYAVTSNKSKKQTIENLSLTLEKLKLFSTEISDSLRLINTIKPTVEVNKLTSSTVENCVLSIWEQNNKRYKSTNVIKDDKKMFTDVNKDDTPIFISAKKLLIKDHNSHSLVSIQRKNVIFKSKTKLSNVRKYVPKKPNIVKFSVKKQSKISLNFEKRKQLKY